MKKLAKFITLSSVVVLTSVAPLSAFADEATAPASSEVVAPDASATVPTDTTISGTPGTTTPTETPTTPTVPSEDTTVPSVTPTTPSTDTSGTSEVVTPGNDVPSTDTTTTDTTTTTDQSSTTTTTDPSSTDKQEEPKTDTTTTTDTADQTKDASADTTTTPSADTKEVTDTNGNTATVTTDLSVPTNNPNISADTAYNAGASQVGTTSTATGQVVENVTADAPVYTNTGYQVVSTQDSQLVVANADGSTSTVAPETIGAVVNADKTISVQTASGEMKTLPSTGEETGIFATISGFALLGFAWLLRKKKGQA